MHAGIHHPPTVGLETPQVWPWRPPPGCGPGDPPPWPVPSTSPLGVGLETPPGQTPQPAPGCGPGDPPRPDPSTSPLGVGLETPLARPLKLPLGCGHGNLQGMLGYTPPWRPARHAGIPLPPGQIDMCKNKLRLRAVIKQKRQTGKICYETHSSPPAIKYSKQGLYPNSISSLLKFV